MRIFLSIAALAVPAACLCQAGTYAGTKTDAFRSLPADGPSSSGLMPFFQMLLALGIVFVALKLLLPKLLHKLKKKLEPSAAGGITLEESAVFAGGSLYIIEARGTSLLVSVATTGVACLATLPSKSQPEPSFLDVLDDARQASCDQDSACLATAAQTGDSLMEDVQRTLNDHAEPSQDGPTTHAVVRGETIITRLPDNTAPLTPVDTEPQPWQPRKLTPQDREQEIEAVLRRLQRLSR